MKKLQTSILVFLAFIVWSSYGCMAKNDFDPAPYTSYLCYDYHLACLDVCDEEARTIIGNEDESQFSVLFRKPAGESDEAFICASVRLLYPLASPQIVIMQNPDHYIDVLADWSIKKIEICSLDPNQSNRKRWWEKDGLAKHPTEILAVIDDSDILKGFADFVLGEETVNAVIPNHYYREKYIIENKDYRVFIRVYFNESHSIVWDASVESFLDGISVQSPQRIIMIDKGRTPNPIFSEDPHYASIEAYSELFNILNNAIDRAKGK